MRLVTPLTVFVVAILITEGRTWAQQTPQSAEPYPPTSAGVYGNSGEPAQCPVNGYDQYRQVPDEGAPGSAGFGLKHFLLPLHAYTTWYRPRAATLTTSVRCAPDPFRPRGFGHLFAEPCDGFRMEYSPYGIGNGCSQYGPAYIARQPDQRCSDCDCNR
ncbi:MAG: hypothetical protein KDA89_18525 [Planctomycetaceae bacterium]|nr:hypothetical protein [Planctomycetaceae bacterium]